MSKEDRSERKTPEPTPALATVPETELPSVPGIEPGLGMTEDGNDPEIKAPEIERSLDRALDRSADRITLEISGARHTFYIHRDRNQYSVWHNGRTYHFSRAAKAGLADAAAPAASGDITALMPGKILRVDVSVGVAVGVKVGVGVAVGV